MVTLHKKKSVGLSQNCTTTKPLVGVPALNLPQVFFFSAACLFHQNTKTVEYISTFECGKNIV